MLNVFPIEQKFRLTETAHPCGINLNDVYKILIINCFMVLYLNKKALHSKQGCDKQQ